MSRHPLRVRIAPLQPQELLSAASSLGARVVGPGAGADILVWTSSRPAGIDEALEPSVRWVQLPAAGVERWIESGLTRDGRVWMSAAGAYSEHVAEHAVAGLLAAVHGLSRHARHSQWSPVAYRPLTERRVAVVGAGGIGKAVIQRLTCLGGTVVAVTRTESPVEHAQETVAAADASSVWGRIDDIVLTVPATAATRHLVDEAALRALPADGCLVNVGRGETLDTEALVRVLNDGHLGGVVLDVTDPEPLPAGHPLWDQPDVIVSSHSANPASLRWPALARHVATNLQRIAAGDRPLAVIGADKGY